MFHIEGVRVRRFMPAPEGTRALFVDTNALPRTQAEFEALDSDTLPIVEQTVMMFAVVCVAGLDETVVVPCVVDVDKRVVPVVGSRERKWPHFLGFYGPGCTGANRRASQVELALAKKLMLLHHGELCLFE